MIFTAALEDFVYLSVTKDLRHGNIHWITHMRTGFYFLVSFLPFFSALFSFKLLAGFFFPSFLVSMFLLMMFLSVFPAGAGTFDFPAGTENAFFGQKNLSQRSQPEIASIIGCSQVSLYFCRFCYKRD